MAGIGFELRKLLQRDSFLGLLQGYGYAGIIGAGPCVLSVTGMLIVSVISMALGADTDVVIQFLTSVTYLIAGSLILTGPLQLLFTRYVSDRIYEKREEVILPNLLGALFLTTVASGGLGALLVGATVGGSLLYRLLLVASFVVLANVWVIVLFVSGMKRYQQVLAAFFLGYLMVVLVSPALGRYGVEGLLSGFFIGHAFLLFFLLAMVLRAYPVQIAFRFCFLRRSQAFYSLAVTGLAYNLGVWIDKIVFWANDATSVAVAGPLRASPIYDMPVFLSYFALIPGLSVFLVRVETDFAEHHEAFYRNVRGGGTLQEIERLRDEMVLDVQRGIYEIFRVQGVTIAVMGLLAPFLLDSLGLSPAHQQLFLVQLVAVSGLVLFMALLNVLFYLDRRGAALVLTILFAVSNGLLSLGTLKLGPAFYGYGFAGSVSLVCVASLLVLSRIFPRLEYDTFMLRS